MLGFANFQYATQHSPIHWTDATIISEGPFDYTNGVGTPFSAFVFPPSSLTYINFNIWIEATSNPVSAVEVGFAPFANGTAINFRYQSGITDATGTAITTYDDDLGFSLVWDTENAGFVSPMTIGSAGSFTNATIEQATVSLLSLTHP